MDAHFSKLSPTHHMKLNIRDVVAEDLPAILDIYNDQILHGTATFHTVPQPLSERAEWLVRLRGESYPCIVAEVMDDSDADASDGHSRGSWRTVGWCNLWHYNVRPAYAGSAELSLYIHKDFRGKGIGEKLLQAMLVEAQKQGDRFHTIIAGVTTENTRTMNFWRKQGFELRGTLREVGRKFGRWLDVAYFQIFLEGEVEHAMHAMVRTVV
ncbi:GCN5-related N-acetyltransferase [Pilatotrama ljubarskyi]|nr:GCN5-related N-acetyltransferase [Pilatotrama ljubarskyi]